jgi:hypothetical protein
MQKFYSKIAGVTIGDRQQFIKKYLHEGDRLIVVREYNNAYDANAIALYAGNYQVGYFPKKVAELLAPQMDAGSRVDAFVATITGGGENYLGVNIEINVYNNGQSRSFYAFIGVNKNLVIRNWNLDNHDYLNKYLFDLFTNSNNKFLIDNIIAKLDLSSKTIPLLAYKGGIEGLKEEIIRSASIFCTTMLVSGGDESSAAVIVERVLKEGHEDYDSHYIGVLAAAVGIWAGTTALNKVADLNDLLRFSLDEVWSDTAQDLFLVQWKRIYPALEEGMRIVVKT